MYSTQDDILERIPEETVIQLTDDEDTGAIVATRVTAAIGRADGEIDFWCGRRYSVPFTTVPDIIAELSTDMAIYFLYGRTLDEMPKTRVDAYKNAVRMLEKISEGKGVDLGVALATVTPSGTSASFTGNDRQFTRDKLRDM